MKKKVLVCLLIFLVIAGYCPQVRGDTLDLNISAKSFVLIDPLTGRVLAEKNSEEKRAMASTTKIMTAIVALERGNLKSNIRVSSRAASTGGSSFHLKTGETLSLESMLYGLLLPSGNDAAVAIAEHIGGSKENFVKMMNEKAVELGALNTNFQNPHGLDEPNHYTTAKDLALIAKYAYGNNKFQEIIQTKAKEIKEGNYTRKIYNTNRLLWEFEGVNGIKTGYTGNAGKCLVASARKNNFELISVVLGSSNHFIDSSKLLNYGFNNYDLVTVVKKNQINAVLTVEKGKEKEVALVTKDDIKLLMKRNENIKINIIAPKIVRAPVYEGETLGEIEIFIDDDLVYSAPLIAMKEVELQTYGNILNKILKYWIKNNA